MSADVPSSESRPKTPSRRHPKPDRSRRRAAADDAWLRLPDATARGATSSAASRSCSRRATARTIRPSRRTRRARLCLPSRRCSSACLTGFGLRRMHHAVQRRSPEGARRSVVIDLRSIASRALRPPNTCRRRRGEGDAALARAAPPCSNCGVKTDVVDDRLEARLPACKVEQFPRTDPVAIDADRPRRPRTAGRSAASR